MSGTSMDGIDATLVNTNGINLERENIQHFQEYKPHTLRLLLIAFKNPLDYIKESSVKKTLNNLITIDHARAIKSLLKKTNIKPDLIGFHGQTIYHNPNKKITLQLGNPQLLADLTKIDIISDFRKNDILNHGEGAPIAPIYHKHLITKLKLPTPCCFINIGGVSNLTYYNGKELIAFDTGPGNGLMDTIIQEKTNLKFDNKGCLASTGNKNNKIIDSFFKHSYFQKKPPKSLDRQTFKKILLKIENRKICLEDSITTLAELTIDSIIKGYKLLPEEPKFSVIMGGGMFNLYLVSKLKQRLPGIVKTAKEVQLPGNMIEAELIAYLSARSIYNLPFTFPKTTGVAKALSGGNYYQTKFK